MEDGQLRFHPATFRRVPMTRTGTSELSALGGEVTVRLGDSPDRLVFGVRDLGEFEFERVAGWGP